MCVPLKRVGTGPLSVHRPYMEQKAFIFALPALVPGSRNIWNLWEKIDETYCVLEIMLDTKFSLVVVEDAWALRLNGQVLSIAYSTALKFTGRKCKAGTIICSPRYMIHVEQIHMLQDDGSLSSASVQLGQGGESRQRNIKATWQRMRPIVINGACGMPCI